MKTPASAFSTIRKKDRISRKNNSRYWNWTLY